jgi:hypothetical protein
MGAVRSGRVIKAVLDPLLMPAGFQEGQCGTGGDGREGDVQVLYCAGHDGFSDRYPRLPQANQQAPGGTCVDLVVEVRADATLGRLDLEAMPVAETLRHVGLVADGQAVAKLTGRSMSESLPIIAGALKRLFEETAE